MPAPGRRLVSTDNSRPLLHGHIITIHCFRIHDMYHNKYDTYWPSNSISRDNVKKLPYMYSIHAGACTHVYTL